MKKYDSGTAMMNCGCMCCCMCITFNTSKTDLFSTSNRNIIYTPVRNHIALVREIHSESPDLLFYQVLAMNNYFEKLVRANFRFGRMCRC